MPRLAPALALLLLALGSAPAAAQAAAGAPPEFTRYLASEAHRRALIGVAQDTNELLPDHCGTVEITPGGPARIERAPRFDANGRPIDGIWAEPVTVRGCGVTRRFNVLTVASPDRAPQLETLVPGNSIAAAPVQRQGVAHAFAAATRQVKDCQRLAVIDTRFVAFETAPAGGARPWREAWTVWACGRHIEVPMHFAPEGKGVKISAAPLQAKPR